MIIKNSFLCEKRIDKIRIHYKINYEKIIILDLVYLGKVNILNITKKDNKQQGIIDILKKEFKKDKFKNKK